MSTRGEPVVVAVPAGRVRGLRDGRAGAIFAGIPFAQPPVGELRFRPPQALSDSEAEMDATGFRAAPAQAGSTTFAVSPRRASAVEDRRSAAFGSAATPNDVVTAAIRPPDAASEDCLYLNVWTPSLDDQQPVLVWIYGGGFEAGDAASPITDGAVLSRLTGTVVVSINYRVGALGFGYWRGIGGKDCEECSNLGLQDQVAALRWVRRNIAAFGGDAANVTVVGESAGAFCIGALLTLPTAQGLFDKAILNSGSTRRTFSVTTANTIAEQLMTRMGLSTLEDLRFADLDALLIAQREVIDRDIGARNLPGGRSWGVVLDGLVVPADPHERLAAGACRDIPLLIGANRDEVSIFRFGAGSDFQPADVTELRAEFVRAGISDPEMALECYRQRVAESSAAPGELGALRSAFLTDAIYRRPATDMAAAQRGCGGRAWTYLLSGAPCGADLGAFHGADLVYAFDLLAGIETSGEYREIRDALVLAWSTFARTGNPGWVDYDPDQPKRTRNFGGVPYVTEPPPDALNRIWTTDVSRAGRGV